MPGGYGGRGRVSREFSGRCLVPTPADRMDHPVEWLLASRFKGISICPDTLETLTAPTWQHE
jgi:hypothetical protein